ncbi:MAG: hypothetical protein IJ764_02075 [Bacteroidales bacterium]|nr:hypothetical protein [Bacteroidales bacterium]
MEDPKALHKEVHHLNQQFYDDQMRAAFYETMVEVAKKTFNIEVQNAGSRQSKGCTKQKVYVVNNSVYWLVNKTDLLYETMTYCSTV